jgi:hypothetical protein
MEVVAGIASMGVRTAFCAHAVAWLPANSPTISSQGSMNDGEPT